MPQARRERQKKCCGCIFSLGALALCLWLLFVTTKPTCSIEEFDVFALTKTIPSSSPTGHNNTIYYDLKLKNRNFNKGIYYDTLNLTFYYKPNLVNDFPIGNATFTPFYQGHRKSTHRFGDIEAKGVKWEHITKLAIFRVELATSVRYKHLLWKTKRRRFMVGADLKVNDEGSLVKVKGKKGIKLTSNAKNDIGHFQVLGILGILLFIHSC
ncbi:Protein NDR1 [Bienertia sinuspersici]